MEDRIVEQLPETLQEAADKADVESSGANSAEITKLRTTIACMDAAVRCVADTLIPATTARADCKYARGSGLRLCIYSPSLLSWWP